MIVEFHPAASAEFDYYTDRYEGAVPDLGWRFIREVEGASDLISNYPEIGQEIEYGFRHFVLDEFPHSLIYSIEPDRIWVVAVAHHKRRSGYWHERVER